MIPIARPDVGPEEAAAVAEVLSSGMIVQGTKVAELEERWAEYCGVKHAIAVSNGTVALMCIYAGLGLEPGDEVITVSHTFNATVSAILFTGATPVFVDIEPDTYLIDAARIEATITPRTRAISPVHLFGLVADMDMITAIADRYGLAVVEDACQAHGATFRGRRAGSFGHGAFSLYGTKNMTTGEGGFITTNDDRLADFIRLYRSQGMRQRYHHEILGYNFRLTDIGAAIGLVQFAKLERNTAPPPGDRRALRRRRSPTCPIRYPGDARGPDPRVPPVHDRRRARTGRDRRGARGAGIGAGIYYPIPVHRQPYVMERGLHADLPVTDARRSGRFRCRCTRG